MYNNARIEEIEIALIKPETVPLKQERLLQKSLIPDEGGPIQWEEIKVTPIDEPPYKYQYINGRRRGESLRAHDVKTVRAIIVELTEDELHVAALVANSGKPNPGDEALHFAYLRDKMKMSIDEIVLQTNYKKSIVEARLRIHDKLTKRVFDKVLEGEVTASTAWEFTRMPKKKQITVLNSVERNSKGRIPRKPVAEAYRASQAKNINQLMIDMGAEIKQPESVTLTGEMMELIANDEFIEVSWRGEKLKICRCE